MGTTRALAMPGSAWLSDRLREARNRLLESQRFQRMAARFPLTRRVSARKAKACFDLCAGFVYSQVLQACVRLDLFDKLARRPMTLPDIARETALAPDRARRLVLAAVALELLETRSGERYGLGPLGAAMRGNPGVRAMIAHHELFYADMADPVALLRGEVANPRLAAYWPYATAPDRQGLDADAVGPYTDLMAASQQFVADDILNAHDVTRHRRVMDIGGGDGSFLRAVARREAGPLLTLFDLPSVVAMAGPRFEAEGLAPRVTLVGGDFTRDALPGGHDLMTLVRVLHDHDDAVVERLLAAAHAALEPGGVLLVGEPLSGEAQSATFSDAYFGFYLLAMGTGRTRSAAEICAMLTAAGFAEARAVPTPRPIMTGLVMARKAG